jgi:D-glycero-D-manno-heptose 1,7-bisphosphate phosphatase
MPIKTIFLDRDGVINKEIGYLHEISKFEFIDGIFDACKHFHETDYKIIIITNQSGIARGLYSEDDYNSLTTWMVGEFNSNGISILDTVHCPHHPEEKCYCRKPLPGMFLKCKDSMNINMKLSWAIGDKETDIIAAKNAGIDQTILVRSGHLIEEEASQAKFIIDSIKESTSIII